MNLDILTIVPGKKRSTIGGWHAFNAICCHHRGHKPDKRMRAGIIFSDAETWAYSCFNCGFKCGSSPGKQFSRNTKSLLEWSGIDKIQIDRWSFQNFSNKSIYDINTDGKPVVITFNKKELPEGSIPLNAEIPLHQQHVDYLWTRKLAPDSYTYYITPDAERERDRNRVIIPYYYNGELVGYTSRYYDRGGPKYISEQQRGYVFNYDAQPSRANACILVEGQFDAISIGGCAYLGSNISDEQAKLIGKLNREIIVVPDRDSAGMSICARALDLGYRVSIPEWSSEVKDVNDAVARYGRLPTLLSILEASTSSRIIVEMKRKKFVNE
jgi:hypothetical protein